MTQKRELLPTELVPKHYDLRIYNINVANDTFEGYVLVKMDVASTTDKLVLNAKHLEITGCQLTHTSLKTTSSIGVSEQQLDSAKETVTFLFSSEVTGGELVAAIQFNGKIRDDMTGLYKSPYTTSQGETEYLVSTQFEATDARAVFPCFDEPNLKATFDVTIVTEADLVVLSNMPVLDSKTLDSGKKGATTPNSLKEVKFETTVKMSTYLLAWAIGKLEHIEQFTQTKVNGKQIPVRVYAVPGLIKDAKFALETAVKVIDYFSAVFKVDYPIPKLDLLATPLHGSNAMENFGLVTFRTSVIIFDDSSADYKYKKRVAYIIAHELAHQWFGNLVTMDWWDELWLNEGFATYAGYLAIDKVYPDFDIFTDFVSEGLEAALELDSLRSSHPIEVPIFSAFEIDQVFDAISYLKGASIIRMLGSAVGVDKFLEGVSIYLKKYAYGNATTQDLWSSVSEAVGYDVNKFMDAWTQKQGFPYITVMPKSSDPESVVLSQHRFLASNDLTPEEDEATWWIPLFMDDKTGDVPVALSDRRVVMSSSSFFKLNKNTTGAYRVVYDQDILSKITAEFGSLSAGDKIGLISDTTAAAAAGLINVSSVLSLFNDIKPGDITEFAVWSELAKQIGSLSAAFGSDPEVSKPLKKFFQKVYATGNGLIADWDVSDVKLGATLPLLLEQSGTSGVPESVARARHLLQTEIKPNMKLAVWSTILANNPSKEEFELVFKEAVSPETASSHEIALVALGYINSDDAELGDRVLSLFETKAVPQMDALFLGQSLSNNQAMRVRFWQYFKTKFDSVFGKYSSWTIERFIRGTLDKFADEKVASDVVAFFKDKDVSSYERRLNQTLESNAVRVAWTARSADDVKSWLTLKGYK